MAVSIVVGTNSWVTLAEANEYMEGKFDADNWTSLTDDLKNRALVTAFRWIFYSDRFNIPATATATIIKNAQIELADYVGEFFNSHKKRTALRSQGVEDFTLSKWKEKSFKAPDIPSFIVDMLDDYLVGEGGYFPTVARTFSE